MKKMIIVFILLVCVSSNAFAYQVIPDISSFYYSYIQSKDVYKGVYSYKGFANKIKFEFWTPTNVYYTHTETYNGGLTGKVWLFCNGTYDLTIYNNDYAVGKIKGIITTQLGSQPCLSSADYNDINQYFNDGDNGGDLNLNGGNLDGGGNRISYNHVNGGYHYDLYRWNNNLNDWNTTPEQTNSGNDGDSGFFDVNQPNYFKVIARDQNGNTINFNTINNDQFNYNVDPNTCNGCKSLSEMLACPAWDQYMGEFSNMISSTLPIPLNDSMDYLIDQLKEQDTTPAEPTAPEPFDPGYDQTIIDLPEPIETDINPEPTDFQLEPPTNDSQPINLLDPLDWQPDDNDKDGGYIPPNPEPDQPPAYTGNEGELEQIPDYTTTNTSNDEIPDYTTTNPSNDEIPDYTTSNPGNDEIPDYSTGNQNGNTPDYTYNE